VGRRTVRVREWAAKLRAATLREGALALDGRFGVRPGRPHLRALPGETAQGAPLPGKLVSL